MAYSDRLVIDRNGSAETMYRESYENGYTTDLKVDLTEEELAGIYQIFQKAAKRHARHMRDLQIEKYRNRLDQLISERNHDNLTEGE